MTDFVYNTRGSQLTRFFAHLKNMPATNELLQEGRYRICQPTDGSGNVFEAYDTVRNTNVIVREIPVRLNKVATVSQRESLQLAFANQAKALTEIEHDALLQVRDFFSEIDRQYLVMDSPEGEDLRQLIKTNKQPFEVSQVTAWADELLDALQYLHTQKPPIVHLNIRPENLKLSPAGKIKLVGFNLEGSMGPEESQPDEGDLRYSPMEKIWPGLDAASQKVITNSYDDRSERILKEPPDARSDIYALGATLYFLITGSEPIDPLERSIEMLEGKLDPLREPTTANPSIPPEISDVLMKALEIKRENRYDSALIMRQVLQTALERVAERGQVEFPENEQPTLMRQPAEAKPDAVPPVDVKRHDADAEKRKQEELLQQQQREAEKRRLETERQEEESRAQRLLKEKAEAERLQKEKSESERLKKEQEEAERLARTTAVPDDDLLEIPVTAEVRAHGETATDVDEDELAAVLDELEKADAANAGVKAEPRSLAGTTEVHVTGDTANQTSPALHQSDAGTSFDSDIFSDPAKSRSSLPIPAMAGAVVLVIVVAVAGWFALSGSSEPPKPQPVVQQPVQESEPVQSVESSTAPTNDASASTPSESETAPPADSSESSTQAAPKAAPTAKPKKPEKSATEKKKVTVDDLINDN